MDRVVKRDPEREPETARLDDTFPADRHDPFIKRFSERNGFINSEGRRRGKHDGLFFLSRKKRLKERGFKALRIKRGHGAHLGMAPFQKVDLTLDQLDRFKVRLFNDKEKLPCVTRFPEKFGPS